MEPALDREELRRSIRQGLSAASDPQAVRKAMEGGDRMAPLWTQMAELGWFGLPIAEQYGGLGMGFAEVSILFEELGRYLIPLPVLPTLLAAEAVSLAGGDQQKQTWLPAIAAGRLKASIALPEGAPNDALPRLEAGRLSGAVSHLLYADSADQLFVPAREGQGAPVLVAIARDASGVSITSKPAIDMTRILCAAALQDVAVSPEQVMRLSAQHWDALIDHASAALACDSVGGAQHIFERTIAYMRTRVQFDRPIGSFQALKHRCANWKILLEAAAALAQHAAETVAAKDPAASAAASSAKFYACDAYNAIAGDCVQLHGGIGFTWDHECHLFLKRANLNQVLFGTSTRHKERVAERAFAETAA